MAKSATIEESRPGLRERKRIATRAAITDTARVLVGRHGFTGFTIEELCERVGISRRTFFNYFPSKEDALIGRQEDGFPDDLVEEFVRAGASGPAGHITATLLDDLAELACQTAERATLSREDYAQLVKAIRDDPSLFAKIVDNSAAREREVAELVAERESIAADDPRAVMASVMVSALTRRAGHDYFTQDAGRSYRQILTDHTNALRQLLG